MFTQLDSSRIIASLAARSKREVLVELATAVAGRFPEYAVDDLCAILLERESLGSTGVGDGIAIPHGKLKGLREVVLWVGRSIDGIPFDSHDSKPAHLFFLLLAPEDAPSAYLKTLARLARALKTPQIRARLMAAPDSEALAAICLEVL